MSLGRQDRGDQEGWAILGWTDEASELLGRCLNSGDANLLHEATDFIHYLGARGYREFRGLIGGQ